MRKGSKITLTIIVALFSVAAVLLSLLSFSLPLWDRSGWAESGDGSLRYLDRAGDPLTGWQIIEDGTYFFDPAQGGDMVTGWFETDAGQCYFAEDGRLYKGWLEHDNTKYYLTDAGTMAIGWLELDNERYYFGEDGQMETGWLQTDDGSYFLIEDGTMHTGWLDMEHGRYYLGQDGVMVTGWQMLDSGRYYFRDDGSMVIGWLALEDNRWYLDDNGVIVTGWLETADGKCYLDEDGCVAYGWLELDGSRYYLGADGWMHTGWLTDGEERYYFSEDGAMVTGWLEYETDRYYFAEDGTMSVGEVVIDGTSNFFTSQGKYVLLVNGWNPVPEDYEPSLVEFHGYQIDASCAEELDALLAACKDAGYTYYLNSVYRSLDDQQGIWDRRYQRYLDEGDSPEEALKRVSQSVAVPGTSEHHLGLAADVGGSPEMYAWMGENSWKYGFIVRYPSGKTDYTGIIYEPWHVRYVGVELAQELYELDLCMEEYMEMLTEK